MPHIKLIIVTALILGLETGGLVALAPISIPYSGNHYYATCYGGTAANCHIDKIERLVCFQSLWWGQLCLAYHTEYR